MYQTCSKLSVCVRRADWGKGAGATGVRTVTARDVLGGRLQMDGSEQIPSDKVWPGLGSQAAQGT